MNRGPLEATRPAQHRDTTEKSVHVSVVTHSLHLLEVLQQPGLHVLVPGALGRRHGGHLL